MLSESKRRWPAERWVYVKTGVWPRGDTVREFVLPEWDGEWLDRPVVMLPHREGRARAIHS